MLIHLIHKKPEKSNRFCFNDGYHTSHHLNPQMHWYDQPNTFMRTQSRYENEYALVFRDLDYVMLTYRLLQKDYSYIAKHMVPIGVSQTAMSTQDKIAMLRMKTKKFSEEDIQKIFHRSSSRSESVIS